MAEITGFVERVVATIGAADGSAMADVAREELGRCPVCSTPVTEGWRAYQCANRGSCSFVIYKQIARRAISPALVQVLLSRGRSQPLRGFRSKRGKRFAATLILSDDGTVEMSFDQRRSRGGRAAESDSAAATAGRRVSRSSAGRRSGASRPRAAALSTPVGARCPSCRQGRIIAGSRGWGCSRWQEACRFVVWFVHGDKRIPDDEAARLMRRGQTRLMDDLSPDGPARLVLDLDRADNVRIQLGKRRRRRS
ncbi:MAG: topoisomerase C-terminal repeat-containing protein, partial [Myxococcota bacterium]